MSEDDDPLLLSAGKLRRIIGHVREMTGSPTVTVVARSTGLRAARVYLAGAAEENATTLSYLGDVARLVDLDALAAGPTAQLATERVPAALVAQLHHLLTLPSAPIRSSPGAATTSGCPCCCDRSGQVCAGGRRRHLADDLPRRAAADRGRPMGFNQHRQPGRHGPGVGVAGAEGDTYAWDCDLRTSAMPTRTAAVRFTPPRAVRWCALVASSCRAPSMVRSTSRIRTHPTRSTGVDTFTCNCHCPCISATP